MSLILTRKAPLRVGRGWSARVVADDHGWHLAISTSGSRGAARTRYHALTRRRCLDLLLAVKVAWWRVAFRRAMRRAGTDLAGIHFASEFVEIGGDWLGDHVLVFGTRPAHGAGRAEVPPGSGLEHQARGGLPATAAADQGEARRAGE
jgi:hypothetical protein